MKEKFPTQRFGGEGFRRYFIYAPSTALKYGTLSKDRESKDRKSNDRESKDRKSKDRNQKTENQKTEYQKTEIN